MKQLLGCLLLLGVSAFGQTTTGSISEWHTLYRSAMMKALNFPGGWPGDSDRLQVFVKSDRADVNQYTVTASFESDGAAYVQTNITSARTATYSLVMFMVPPGSSKIRVSVTAQWVEPKEEAVFE